MGVSVLRVISIFVLILISGLLYAAESGSAKQLYEQYCASCHGAQGQGNDALGSPALAGQQASYLVRQLDNFAKSIRGADKGDEYAQQMQPMATLLETDADKRQVAEYLQSLKHSGIEQSSTEELVADVKHGYKIYQSSCGACHGPKAEGNELLNAPKLSGLSVAYLSRQYQNFLSGSRGRHKDDKLGRQMKMMAATVSDKQQIQDVLAYIATQ